MQCIVVASPPLRFLYTIRSGVLRTATNGPPRTFSSTTMFPIRDREVISVRSWNGRRCCKAKVRYSRGFAGVSSLHRSSREASGMWTTEHSYLTMLRKVKSKSTGILLMSPSLLIRERVAGDATVSRYHSGMLTYLRSDRVCTSYTQTRRQCLAVHGSSCTSPVDRTPGSGYRGARPGNPRST